jgi:hypothetical protein
MQEPTIPAGIDWPIAVRYGDLPEAETFAITADSRLSIYETVMVYCGRPPWHPMLRKLDASHSDVVDWLSTFNDDATTAILRNLLQLVESRQLPAATILDEDGRIDLVKSTVVAGDALAKLSAARGERPWFTSVRTPEAVSGEANESEIYRTGVAGRPTSWSLVEAEVRRHWDKLPRNEMTPKLETAEWARIILRWLRRKHPKAPRLMEKTLKNKLAPLLRQLRSARAANQPPEMK